MMKISIIVPVYNASKYLPLCLESILNQTYSNLEILVVDDGSTDNSSKICQDYAREDHRIIFISQANQGPGIARNTGLNIASGDYISFVDSDDFISSDMYEDMINIALKNNADIVHCGYEKINTEGKVLKRSKLNNVTITGINNCTKEFCLKRNTNYFSHGKLIKKSVIGNIRFDKFSQSEDALFLLKVFMNCNILSVINKPYYKYSQTPNSICRTNFNLNKLDAVNAGKELYKTIDAKYPELSIYFAKYIARYALRCYMGIYQMDNFSDKDLLLKAMHEDFSENFKKVKQSKLKLLDWFTRVYLSLFYYSPDFTTRLYTLKNQYL